MDLKKYINKKVKIIDINDKEWIGVATSIDLAINYDDVEYDELDLEINGLSSIIAFPENEIKSIEIIYHSIKIELVECCFYTQNKED